MVNYFNKIYQLFNKKIVTGLLLFLTFAAAGLAIFYFKSTHDLNIMDLNLQNTITETNKELTTLKNADQVKINQNLTDEIKNINTNYKNSISAYERMTDLKAQKLDTSKLDTLYAAVVNFLADRKYASAAAKLADLITAIEAATPKVVVNGQPPAVNAPQNNTPPGSGYSRQVVSADGQNYTVDIVAANLNSTKVIIDTASDSDCANDCPVLPLATYATRSGAWAGINGSFFCPAEYPSCAGKTNSFDTLLMNKNKHYFNSANNVYSTIPLAVFSQGSARFLGQTLNWGRDTSPDGVIANYPLLVSGYNIVYSEPANEPKFGQNGPRSFIANKGNMVYIGYVYAATMGESAKVVHALGFENALNLDEGGSTALWVGGSYKAGPGRNIPNAILFVNR